MSFSLLLLPVSSYIALMIVFTRQLKVETILEALIKAHLVVFTFILISTEFLSAINSISFSCVLIMWVLFFISLLAIISKFRNTEVLKIQEAHEYSSQTYLLTAAIVLILAATFLTAILHPPNTSDSMTYHMSRVVHWINNNDVSFYPTSITRQNYLAPLAEFAIMHLQVLTGSDWYANLVQWVSFLVIVCLGFVIAAELGLDKRQQLITAFIIATLPMGVLQASSTQNDLVVSSFIMSFALFMLRIQRNFSFENILFGTIALGLALMTKGTAYIYCAAVGTILAIPLFIECGVNRARIQEVVVKLSLIVFIALVLNAGHFSRNFKLYGHPLSTEVKQLYNEDASPAALLANTVRNGALHIGTPSILINNVLEKTLKDVLGSQLNNPRTTLQGTTFYIPYNWHEDFAGNLIHMLIIFLTLILLPLLLLKGYYYRTTWYAISLILGALLFFFLLKWQPWASRLHTPLFAMAAPLIAIAITTTEYRAIGKRFSYVILICLFCYGLIFTFANKTRSLISLDWYYKDRAEFYFKNTKDVYQEFMNVISILQLEKQKVVGIYCNEGGWEYPLWMLSKAGYNGERNISFRHVGVSNASMVSNLPLPKYVVATIKLDKWKDVDKYTAIYISTGIILFRKI